MHEIQGFTIMKINRETLQLLSQIGFLACVKGETEKGKVIIEGVEINAEYNPSAMMGVAISRIYTGQYKEAIATLKNSVLSLEPDNIEAKTFLSIALNKSGKLAEAAVLFKEISVLKQRECFSH